MTAYAIFIRNRLDDPAEIAIYAQKGRAARGDHPLTPLAYYGEFEVLEGEPADGVVLLSFPTMAAAKAWYFSPAYQEALAHRLKASDSRVVLVQGLD